MKPEKPEEKKQELSDKAKVSAPNSAPVAPIESNNGANHSTESSPSSMPQNEEIVASSTDNMRSPNIRAPFATPAVLQFLSIAILLGILVYSAACKKVDLIVIIPTVAFAAFLASINFVICALITKNDQREVMQVKEQGNAEESNPTEDRGEKRASNNSAPSGNILGADVTLGQATGVEQPSVTR